MTFPGRIVSRGTGSRAMTGDESVEKNLGDLEIVTLKQYYKTSSDRTDYDTEYMNVTRAISILGSHVYRRIERWFTEPC